MKKIEEVYNKMNDFLFEFKNVAEKDVLKNDMVERLIYTMEEIAEELKNHVLEQKRKPNQKWQKQAFNILISNNTHKSVIGEVYDQYGIHKDDKESRLTHIPTGMRIDNVPASYTSRKITKTFLKKLSEEIVEKGYKLSGDTENDREENIKTRDFMIEFTRSYFNNK